MRTRGLFLVASILVVGCTTPKVLPPVDAADGRCTRLADTPESALPCTLSLLTYNVRGLSPLVLHETTRGDDRFRSASLGWLARDYDLVLLQEDFEYHHRIIEGPKLAFVERGSGPRPLLWPLRVLTLPLFFVPFSPPYGSGLTIAAPALEPVGTEESGDAEGSDGALVRKSLKACNGWFSQGTDCWSNKGLLGVRLDLRNGTEIDVYTTHLDAGRSAKDRKAREKQLERMARKIRKKSGDRAVIVAGDLNSRYDPAPTTPPAPDPPAPGGESPNPDYQVLYEALIEPLGLQDSGARQGSDHFGHRVDWVLYRSSTTVGIEVLGAGEDARFRHPANRDVASEPADHAGLLSDHPALGVCFLVRRLGGAGASPGDATPAPRQVDPTQPFCD